MESNYRSKLQDLTIRSDFMFSAVMTTGDNCKDFLEMVLGFPIERVEIDREKNFFYHPDYHGIRLDIYAKDENNTHYNVEMQVVKEHIERRTRYYHSQMDMSLLPRGSDYTKLPDTYVIFICAFDPFKLGKYVYRIDNHIKEVPDYPYNDGSHTIILSTKGANINEVPEEIINFLDFIEKDSADNSYFSSDAYVNRLQQTVYDIKMSRDMEQRFMLLEELLQREKNAGREEGRIEGREEGRIEGREEGTLTTVQENLLKILRFKNADLPDFLTEQITNTKDIEELNRMFDLALESDSIEAFMKKCTIN